MKTNDSMHGTVGWVMYAVPYASTRNVVDGAAYWAVERAVGGVTAHPAIKRFLTSPVDGSVP